VAYADTAPEPLTATEIASPLFPVTAAPARGVESLAAGAAVACAFPPNAIATDEEHRHSAGFAPPVRPATKAATVAVIAASSAETWAASGVLTCDGALDVPVGVVGVDPPDEPADEPSDEPEGGPRAVGVSDGDAGAETSAVEPVLLDGPGPPGVTAPPTAST
jgi:hypothetical protein